MLKQSIGFIGAGQMATALGQGFVKAGLVPAENLLAADPDDAARQRFAEATGGQTGDDNARLVAGSDVVFLAVKPHLISAVAAELKGHIPAEKLVVSIAAGIQLQALAEGFGDAVRLVRVMPNTPCLVGQGACGFCPGHNATEEDGRLVKRLLEAVGVAFEVDEKLLALV